MMYFYCVCGNTRTPAEFRELFSVSLCLAGDILNFLYACFAHIHRLCVICLNKKKNNNNLRRRFCTPSEFSSCFFRILLLKFSVNWPVARPAAKQRNLP